MSGGSWDYFYGRLEEVASRLQCARDTLRKAFGSHLQKCANALLALFMKPAHEYYRPETDDYPMAEAILERQWREQKGIDPRTGKAWLTPRMERNSIRIAEALATAHPKPQFAGKGDEVKAIKAALGTRTTQGSSSYDR